MQPRGSGYSGSSLYLSFFKKSRHMKSLFLALGFLGMVFTTSAQNRAVSQKRLPQSDVSKTANNQGEIYARLTSYNQTNTEVVRFKIDDNVFKMTKDLELRGNIEAMRKHRFRSLSEALNVLASQGWKVHSTFVVRGRHGDEQVYLMSYTTEIGALYPWREKGAKAQSPKR